MRAIAILALSAVTMGGVAARGESPTPESQAPCRADAKLMARLELFFGTSRRGTPVSVKDWKNFLDREVTPRFPDGLSIVEAQGQWRNGAGHLTHERSHLVLIYYTPEAGSDAKIEAIRAAYKTRFQQESVLRADSRSCVSF